MRSYVSRTSPTIGLVMVRKVPAPAATLGWRPGSRIWIGPNPAPAKPTLYLRRKLTNHLFCQLRDLGRSLLELETPARE